MLCACSAGMEAEDGMRSTGIVGSCPHMCPLSEIERRLRIEDVAIFERPDPSVAFTDTSLAVKRFARNVCPTTRTCLDLLPVERCCRVEEAGLVRRDCAGARYIGLAKNS